MNKQEYYVESKEFKPFFDNYTYLDENCTFYSYHKVVPESNGYYNFSKNTSSNPVDLPTDSFILTHFNEETLLYIKYIYIYSNDLERLSNSIRRLNWKTSPNK